MEEGSAGTLTFWIGFAAGCFPKLEPSSTTSPSFLGISSSFDLAGVVAAGVFGGGGAVGVGVTTGVLTTGVKRGGGGGVVAVLGGATGVLIGETLRGEVLICGDVLGAGSLYDF